MLKAGSDVGVRAQEPKIPEAFKGLTIGRIVHVWIRLPVPEQPLVERPAIVTTVRCHERGIISAHVFMSPEDGLGEIVVHETGQEGRPLGADLKYKTRDDKIDWTWHWPERV